MSAVGRFDVHAFLRERGVPDDEIAAAEDQRTLPLLVIDQLLFPGRPRYDEDTLVDKVGVDRDYARALWRAMGFPGLPEGEVAFYDDDLEALRAAVIGDPMRELLPNLVHQTRVTSAALVLYPIPRPSRIPAASAMIFLSAPPSSTPITSVAEYTRKCPTEKTCCTC